MRRAFPAFFAFMAIVAGLIIWHEASTHQEAKRRAARQLKYAGEASSLEQLIHPGMPRPDVDESLKEQSWGFNSRYGRSAAWDEIVPLARESSSERYCNFEQIQVLIEFAPAVSHEASAIRYSPRPFKPRADDIVTRIGSDRQLGDCL